MMNDSEIFYAKDRKSWRRWLKKIRPIKKVYDWFNIRKSLAKKSIEYSQAVDEALCFG